MAWDLNLCVDYTHKVLVPFHFFVQPKSQRSPTPPSQPFPFFNLPTDIQLIVYESCDLATLFQLMRTCSRTRGPATKLFWANTSGNFWYYISDWSLFAYGTRHHPIIQHCPEFAQRITKIELNLGRLEFTFAEDERLSTATRAQDFWTKVCRAFPAVKRVVLSGKLPRRELPPGAGESDKNYTAIATVVTMAPPHVVVHVAFDEGNSARPQRYALWQVTNSPEPIWQVLDKDWTPTRIFLPPRKFASSPLGDLVTFTRRDHDLHLEVRGMDWLKIETYARYALDGVIHCPRLDCDSTFAERSQWKQHLDSTSHWRLGPGYGYVGEEMMELLCFKGTPVEVQDALAARQQRIDAAYRQTKTLQRRVGCGWDWSEEKTEQRRLFEEQFFAQLRDENFAAPGELLMDDQHTCDWIDCLHLYYDPSHVYYAGE